MHAQLAQAHLWHRFVQQLDAPGRRAVLPRHIKEDAGALLSVAAAAGAACRFC